MSRCGPSPRRSAPGAAGARDGQVSASAITNSQRRRLEVGSGVWDGFIGPPCLLPRGLSPERNRRRGAGRRYRGKATRRHGAPQVAAPERGWPRLTRRLAALIVPSHEARAPGREAHAWRSHMEPGTGRATANGVTFHYLEMGRGPLVLCLHGFPDNAYTYGDLLPVAGGRWFSRCRAVHAGLCAHHAGAGRPVPVGAAGPGCGGAHRCARSRARLPRRSRLGGRGHVWRGRARPRAHRAHRHHRRGPSRRPSAATSPRATSATKASGTPTSFRCRTPSRSWPPTTSPSSSTGGETPRRSSIPRPSSSA